MCHQREITIVILVKIWHGFLTLAIPDNQIDLVFWKVPITPPGPYCQQGTLTLSISDFIRQ